MLVVLCGMIGAQSFQGSWEQEFDHVYSASTFPVNGDEKYWPPTQGKPPFEPEHAVVLTKGPHAGKVLMWDKYHEQDGSKWVLRWSIVDPTTTPPTFLNFTLLIPGDKGHFHCAGHAWAHDGDLMVLGGEHPGAETGAKLAYRYVPDRGAYGTWSPKAYMVEKRWYGSALAFWDKKVGIFGGSNLSGENTLHGPACTVQNDGAYNRYESYDTVADTWEIRGNPGVRIWNGPQNGSPIGEWPRMFQLSELCYAAAGFPVWPLGRIFLVPVCTSLCASVAHQERSRPGSGPGIWTDASYPLKLSPTVFHDTPVVLFPGETDLVVAIGGSGGSSQVQLIDMKSQGPVWQYMASLNTARYRHNVVILPDASLLAVRGEGTSGQPLYDSELYKNGDWIEINDGQQYSPRTEHSLAVLLPDGRVFLAGGKTRTRDYQLYSPWYLEATCRPVIQAPAPATLTYGVNTRAYFDWTTPLGCPGVELEKVVLVAPASVTHHFDQHQRYVELNVTQVQQPHEGQQGWVDFDPPANATYAPPGYYMMFLVTAGGIPSVATWVELK